ncbi:MAG TPA: LuxR C-terminal-related transcriptional regulator [Thermoleophilaceae bacterium]
MAASPQVSEAIEAARAAVSGSRPDEYPSLDELQSASGRVQSALGALAEELDSKSARGPTGTRDMWRLLVELHQLERELIERRFVRRVDGLERVQEGVRGLGEVGSAAGILDRSADGLGESSDFDRVLVSSIRDGALHVESTWCRDDRGGAEALLAGLRDSPMRLDYPLVEAELASSQGSAVVSLPAAKGRIDADWAAALGWTSYAVVTLALGGTTVGLVHADCQASGRTIDAIDREALEAYAEGLAQVFERAVLRGRLRGHRGELRGAVDWMNARLSRLSDSSVAATSGGADGSPAVAADSLPEVAELDELLTPRELEVLRLMARGNTNLAIAKALVVAEGTVKYHVKNILRKLRAANRADAVARYERMTAGLPE